jgi:hypothetical protein
MPRNERHPESSVVAASLRRRTRRRERGQYKRTGEANHELLSSRAPTTCWLTSISGYVSAVDTAPHNQYQYAIYTDSHGVPGRLVGRSLTGMLQPNTWNTLSLRATLLTNTAYWLVYNTNASTPTLNELAYSSTGGLDDPNADEPTLTIAQVSASGFLSGAQPFGTWPSMVGGTATTTQYSLYAALSTTPATSEQDRQQLRLRRPVPTD